MWLAAAVVLLMIVGDAAGFFIYRARKSDAAATLPAATPAPSVEPAPTTTTTTTAADVPVEEHKNVNANPSADKNVKQTSSTKPVVKPTPQVANDREDTRQEPHRPPEPPSFDPLRNPDDRRPPPEPRVRDFPNGTRVEKRADGTTVVTFPDGRTRVFPSGRLPNPRPRRRPGP
jgi:hypothetical protein